MRMHHRLYVRAQLVNRHMHGDFGRALASALDLVPFVIANDQIVRMHHPFADRSWCAEDALGVQTDADIPVVGRYPTFLIDEFSYIDDVLTKLFEIVRHPEIS